MRVEANLVAIDSEQYAGQGQPQVTPSQIAPSARDGAPPVGQAAAGCAGRAGAAPVIGTGQSLHRQNA